ncbi:hypothetical protein JCM19240_5847 [Vibrio maritimus]|uniref:NACHT domain-containing protein n=1 Tax=Vibrio maritimus TaxID=990268 RepID=A0A090SXI9_9VIBR|nr:hypothetical protein JCM19240_5847 [Vibrio maritimus]
MNKSVLQMEPATALTMVALKQVVTQVTKKILDKPWSKDTESAKEVFRQLSEDYAATVYVEKYVTKFLKMRTLHSAESDVYLDEIYSPLTLKVQSNDDEFSIDDDVTLSFSRVVNIIGIAGQGKSTILRKLFLEELKKGERFPFMLELRRVEGTDVISYLKQQLINIGLSFEDGDVEILLQSKKIILLLDGFDEVSSNYRQKMLYDITQLKTRYNCDVIVTTRPGTEICSEVDITNLKVKKLELNDIVSIISKLDKNNDVTELPEIISNNVQLQGTLVSPILVNLLYVCYPYLDTVPENVVDFYDKLFMTLYSRHDKIKNFNREKYTNIGAIEASRIFSAFCFDSLNRGALEFSEESLHDYMQSALKLNQKETSTSEQIVKDLVNITCLIQKDGFNKYVFLHKSIQEFHSAKFISTLPHEHKKRFYLKLVEKIDREDKFDNVLVFLKYIDTNDYNSLLVLNYFKSKKLNHLCSESQDVIIDSIIIDMLKEKKLTFAIKGSQADCETMQVIQQHNILSTLGFLKDKARRNNPDYENVLFNHLFGFGSSELTSNKLTSKDLISVGKLSKGKTEVTVSVYDFLKLNGSIDTYSQLLKEEIISFYNEIYKPIHKKSEQVSRILDIDFDM